MLLRVLLSGGFHWLMKRIYITYVIFYVNLLVVHPQTNFLLRAECQNDPYIGYRSLK